MEVADRFTLANPFTHVKMIDGIKSCDVDPSVLCCWQNRVAQTQDLPAYQQGSDAWVKSLLEFYGPWSHNDKLMLSFLLGDANHPGSMNLFPRMDALPIDSTCNQTRLAFVIMVHKEIDVRLPNLLDAIWAPHHSYMIHVDNGAEPEEWAWVSRYVEAFNQKHGAGNLHLMARRFHGAWGGVSLAYQELASIIELMRVDQARGAKRWSHVINLSAYDFPLKPIKKLEAFFHKHSDVNFIESLGQDWRREQRQSNLHLPCMRYVFTANFSSNHVCPSGVSNWMFKHRPTWVYGEGSQWHFLSRQFVEYLVSSPDAIELLFSLKYTLVPDESFFQSAILSSPYSSTLNKYNYRYLPWGDQLDVSTKHVLALRDTDALFTRKLINPGMAQVLTEEVLRIHQ